MNRHDKRRVDIAVGDLAEQLRDGSATIVELTITTKDVDTGVPLTVVVKGAGVMHGEEWQGHNQVALVVVGELIGGQGYEDVEEILKDREEKP